MPTNRRQFIKQSAGLVAAGMVMPSIFIREAQAQSSQRRILVDVFLGGGTDGLNVVIPYTNARYRSLRPRLAFTEQELVTASTMIDNTYGLHPALSEVLSLYKAGKAAIINGVGYPNPNLSHEVSQNIYHTANPTSQTGTGWLGRYADIALANQNGFTAANIGQTSPKTFAADNVLIPSLTSLATYTYQTDSRFGGDRTNQLNLFKANNNRTFDTGSYLGMIAETGIDAEAGATQLQAATGGYVPGATYPANNGFGNALRLIAQISTSIPTANLFFVSIGGFDNHSAQINTNGDRLTGTMASQLRAVSTGLKAFYDDMVAHGLENNLLIQTFTEFGRRPGENNSFGTDHGSCAPAFLIGGGVNGNQMFGDHPSLEATSLDRAGNMRFTVDFRSIYAEILERWLGADAQAILGGQFPRLGFMK